MNNTTWTLCLLLTVALTLALLTACSDDAEPLAADGAAAADAAVTADAASVDGQLPDVQQPDAALLDAALLDAAQPDAKPAVDAGVGAVSGTVGLSAAITCSAAAATDCKGTLYVGVVDKPVAPPASKLLGALTVQGVDLSGGKQPSFSITGLPAGQQLYVSALLAEGGGALPPQVVPAPKSGDLVLAPQAFTVTPGGKVQKSLLLDARWK